jgi:V/A-type H+-transporting ATPase subunit E
MEKQIQELTDRLYQEGVERGRKRAEEIIAEAQTEANNIILKAKAEAARILAETQKQP